MPTAEDWDGIKAASLQCLSAVWLLVPTGSEPKQVRHLQVSNAFRLCGFWCHEDIHQVNPRLLRLQCLSAVWLLVPNVSMTCTKTTSYCLQCLSAVWLLVPLPFGAKRQRIPTRLQCLSAVWLLVPRQDSPHTIDARRVSNAFRLCGFWCLQTATLKAARVLGSPMPFGCVASGASRLPSWPPSMRCVSNAFRLCGFWCRLPFFNLPRLVPWVSNAFRLCGFWCQVWEITSNPFS